MSAEPLIHQPNCMGCGPENPAGFGLELHLDGERVRGAIRFDRRQEGAPGIAHGGAVSTVLDDTLGTVLIALKIPAVTANLNVDFRAPAYLDRDLTVEAWCERVDGRKIHLKGALREGDFLIAEATALFIQVGLEHFRASGKPIPEPWVF